MVDEPPRTRRASWVDPDDDPREADEPPSGELVTLRQYLDRYRMTLAMKCEGLTPKELATRSIGPSSMSLLGLLRHLARMEHHWFRRTLEGRADVPPLYSTTEEPDRDFDESIGSEQCVDEAWASWRREVEHAREVYARYDDLGHRFVDGEPWEVRGVIVHMIEEYARHCGHADLLRECVDGRVGQ